MAIRGEKTMDKLIARMRKAWQEYERWEVEAMEQAKKMGYAFDSNHGRTWKAYAEKRGIRNDLDSYFGDLRA